MTFTLDFPASKAIYDDLVFTIDDQPVPVTNEKNTASGVAKVAAGQTATLKVGYHSQGLNEWRYSFGSNDVTQVHDFALNMKTNFKDIDFPDNTLSPSEKHETASGWVLRWSYKTFDDRISLACSFSGPTGMVLLDMTSRLNARPDVFYLDTGFLFPETYRLRDVAERILALCSEGQGSR